MEEAPPRLRAFLHAEVTEILGIVDAYQALCELDGIVPDGAVLSWGANDARPEVARIVEHLEWPDVFQMLENLAAQLEDPEPWVQKVNQVLARCGLAYEMGDDGQIELDARGRGTRRGGGWRKRKVFSKEPSDPHGANTEEHSMPWNRRPSEPEKAVSEAFGALEAVAHIATGEKDFGRAIDTVFADSEDWQKALAKSLKNLRTVTQASYRELGMVATRSSAPQLQEALYAVRACGAAIAYIAYLHRE